jgi:hypothetical protein
MEGWKELENGDGRMEGSEGVRERGSRFTFHSSNLPFFHSSTPWVEPVETFHPSKVSSHFPNMPKCLDIFLSIGYHT